MQGFIFLSTIIPTSSPSIKARLWRSLSFIMDAGTSSAKRVFPPLYESSGNASEDRLAFFHILERLKVTYFRHVFCTRINDPLIMSLVRPKRGPDGLIERLYFPLLGWPLQNIIHPSVLRFPILRGDDLGRRKWICD